MKIIVFPFAGGSKYSFSFLKQVLPSCLDLVVLEYPGRGARISEPLLSDINLVMEDALANVIKEIGTGDYVIYGHSMGGLVGYLICKEIHKLQVRPPLKLVVSGCSAPSERKTEKTHLLTTELFWQKVLELGGVPEDVSKDQSLIEFFVPILKSDFKALDNFRYQRGDLSVPIDVFYGTEEIEDVQQMTRWRHETSNQVNVYGLKGDHFFIFDHPKYFCEYFSRLYNNHTTRHLV
jgi:surfactin synthase thioesterase subunit